MALSSSLARFLKRLRAVLAAFFDTYRLASDVDGGDRLSRFITQKRDFNAATGTVRAAIFLPASDGTTSLFRTEALDDATIWDIGTKEVAPSRGPILARGDLAARAVFDGKLGVVRSEPPPRHVEIVKWPADKEARKSLAQLLAAETELRLPA